MFNNSTHTVFLSDGEAAKYHVFEDESGVVIPGRGTYHAVTAAPLATLQYFQRSMEPATTESTT